MNKEKLLKFFQPKWWVLVILFVVFVFGAFQLSIYLNEDIIFTVFATYFYSLISSIVLLLKRKKVLANNIFLFVLIILFVVFFVARVILDSTSCGVECLIDDRNDIFETATVSYRIANIPKTVRLKLGIENSVFISFYNNHSVECINMGASFRFNCGSDVYIKTVDLSQVSVELGSEEILLSVFEPVNFSGTVPCKVEVVCSENKITFENLYDLPVVESKALFIEFSG